MPKGSAFLSMIRVSVLLPGKLSVPPMLKMPVRLGLAARMSASAVKLAPATEGLASPPKSPCANQPLRAVTNGIAKPCNVWLTKA